MTDTLAKLRSFAPGLADAITANGGRLEDQDIAAIAKLLPGAWLTVRSTLFTVQVQAHHCRQYLDNIEKQQENARSLVDIVYRTLGHDRCSRMHSPLIRMTEAETKNLMLKAVPGYNSVTEVTLPE